MGLYTRWKNLSRTSQNHCIINSWRVHETKWTGYHLLSDLRPLCLSSCLKKNQKCLLTQQQLLSERDSLIELKSIDTIWPSPTSLEKKLYGSLGGIFGKRLHSSERLGWTSEPGRMTKKKKSTQSATKRWADFTHLYSALYWKSDRQFSHIHTFQFLKTKRARDTDRRYVVLASSAPIFFACGIRQKELRRPWTGHGRWYLV